MATLRAGIAIGSHQWHVVSLDADGPREVPIGDKRLFATKADLRAALKLQHLVLGRDNKIRSTAIN